MSEIRLLREHLDAMIAHAREVAPAECCGLIGGSDEQNARTIYRLRNVTANPEHIFVCCSYVTPAYPKPII